MAGRGTPDIELSCKSHGHRHRQRRRKHGHIAGTGSGSLNYPAGMLGTSMAQSSEGWPPVPPLQSCQDQGKEISR